VESTQREEHNSGFRRNTLIDRVSTHRCGVAISAALIMAATIMAGTAANAQRVQFSITTLSPRDGGIWTMRPWVGVHDGKFPTFTVGQPASSGVQHIAEDGITGDPGNLLPPSNLCTGLASVYTPSSPCMFEIFNNYLNHGPQTTLGNPTKPGATLSAVFELNRNNSDNQFLSYLVMIVPSNDAFFGTDTANPIRLFTNGNFNNGRGPIHAYVLGSDILDAGTEANDEGANGQMDTAFLNQKVAGTGTHPDPVDANVHKHPGFIPGGPILTQCNNFLGTVNCFPNGDFTQPGYIIADVTIQIVPEKVDDLITLANSLGPQSEIAVSLDAKLATIKNRLGDGEIGSACSLLSSFQAQVSALAGKSIPNTTAGTIELVAADVSQINRCGGD